MPTTLSNPTHRPVKGTYGFRAAAWERARADGAQACQDCGRGHLSPPEAKAGRCWRCSDAKTQDQLAADTADLFTGESAEPSLSDFIDNLEAARARIAALDAKAEGEEPTEEAQAGTWDEGCKPWEFFCKGCVRLRSATERVEAYVKRGCRVVATLDLCRDCGSQVSVCVRG